MVKNIMKIAFRSLLKNKSHTAINLLGLSIGIIATIVVFLILRFDLSFDRYHKDSENIYRLVKEEHINSEIEYDEGIPHPMSQSFESSFPEVEAFSMVEMSNSNLISIDKNDQKVRFEEERATIAFVMPDYFDIFSYQFIAGSPGNLFELPNAAILTKKQATKYFGNYQKAIGSNINLNNAYDLVVTAVVEDPPMNTDLPFKILLNYHLGGSERVWDSWVATSSSVQAFIKLRNGVNIEQFNHKIENFVQKHISKNDPTTIKLSAQPLHDLHSNDLYNTFTGRMATKKEMYTLILIGGLLLLAASINFINLNTALAARRSKEIGVRKILGSSRLNLIYQFMTETAIITLTAILISFLFIQLTLLKIEYIIGYQLPPMTLDLTLILAGILVFIAVTLFAGLYPSIIISGYKPIDALKSKINSIGNSKISVRKSLVVSQLVISQIMIVAIIVVSRQMDFFLSHPIGIETENIIEIPIHKTDKINFESFRTRFTAIEGVKSIAFSNTGAASNNTWGGKIHFPSEKGEITEVVQVKIVDSSYLRTYGIELLAGNNIKQDSIRKYLITEKTMKELGFNNFENLKGRNVRVWGTKGEVVGLVKDFNSTSLHYPKAPMVLWYDEGSFSKAALKIEADKSSAAIAAVQKEWELLYPEFIFSHTYLDENIQDFYINEQRLKKTFGLFAAIALFIGGIGLLGLMSFMVQTRTKEIGVRKVLGANIAQVMHLLTFDFLKLVLIAFIIAAPISWYFMHQWLEDYASKIKLDIWVFALALIFSAIVTLLTIGYKSFRASVVNPVDVLKDE